MTEIKEGVKSLDTKSVWLGNIHEHKTPEVWDLFDS